MTNVDAAKRKQYNKRWKENNPEAARESHRKAQLKWRASNREKIRERQRAWSKANRDKVNLYRRKQHYKEKYGLTMEERDAMVAEQGGCKVCLTTDPGNKYGWVVDHCHATGKVRGILCHHCNMALGNAKDSIDILKKLINYLEENDDVDSL